MSVTPDDYADWDAAYVLGALSPQERDEFEGHLVGCAACRASVAELAGMPGLLAHVPAADVLTFSAPVHAQPASRAPRQPSAARAGRPRRPAWLLGVAASLALVAGGFGGYAAHALWAPDTGRPPIAATPARIAFSSVIASPLTAVVDVVPTSSGTDLRVECQYAATGGSQTGGAVADYAIYVTERSGRSRLAKTWTARPDRVMRPTASSPLPVADIVAVEIREVASGQTLARARL